MHMIRSTPQPDIPTLYRPNVSHFAGKFRVRGLNPGCEYQLRVRSDGEAVSAGAYPAFYMVKVTDGDVKDFDFVLRPVITTMEVQGGLLFETLSIMLKQVLCYRLKYLDDFGQKFE